MIRTKWTREETSRQEKKYEDERKLMKKRRAKWTREETSRQEEAQVEMRWNVSTIF